MRATLEETHCGHCLMEPHSGQQSDSSDFGVSSVGEVGLRQGIPLSYKVLRESTSLPPHFSCVIKVIMYSNDFWQC